MQTMRRISSTTPVRSLVIQTIPDLLASGIALMPEHNAQSCCAILLVLAAIALAGCKRARLDSFTSITLKEKFNNAS